MNSIREKDFSILNNDELAYMNSELQNVMQLNYA